VSLDQRIELREEEEEDVVPISGPALKKLLLTSLRNKWTSEGGPTSAGEAALRFKKYVYILSLENEAGKLILCF